MQPIIVTMLSCQFILGVRYIMICAPCSSRDSTVVAAPLAQLNNTQAGNTPLDEAERGNEPVCATRLGARALTRACASLSVCDIVRTRVSVRECVCDRAYVFLCMQCV
jgi:hypothetical protein